MITMTGRVTMLGTSQWIGEGGIYLTIQRMFYTVNPVGRSVLVIREGTCRGRSR